MSDVAPTHFTRGKLKTAIDRRLPWLPQVAFVLVGGLAFWHAPTVDRLHSPDRLTNAFVGVFTVVGSSIALLLFQRNSDNTHALRFLGFPTVLYALLGIICPIFGLLPLPDSIYRYLFALSLAALFAVLTTLGLVAATSLADQRKAAEEEKLKALRKMQEEAVKKAQGNPKTDPPPKCDGSNCERPSPP